METDEAMEGTLTDIRCPDCHGPIWEERQGNIIEYRCRVGYVYSPLSLAKGQEDVTERFLWETMISLEDAAETAERLAVELGPQYLEEAQRKRAQAADIRRMLGSPEPGK
jgi:two-component system, chemotaxis family, protein-glutamate methylesterase/glutaminase